MENIAKFIYELGQLKRVKRSGNWIMGVKDPETVAEHAYRATIIGRILSELEGADINKVTTMMLLHDIPETRINDIHKVGARYIDFKSAEKAAMKDQLKRLPPKLAKEMEELFIELEERKTKESIVAKEADYLECAFQAKEYYEQGYKDGINWINNVERVLTTKSAKALMKQLKKTSYNDWWKDLKNVPKTIKE